MLLLVGIMVSDQLLAAGGGGGGGPFEFSLEPNQRFKRIKVQYDSMVKRITVEEVYTDNNPREEWSPGAGVGTPYIMKFKRNEFIKSISVWVDNYNGNDNGRYINGIQFETNITKRPILGTQRGDLTTFTAPTSQEISSFTVRAGDVIDFFNVAYRSFNRISSDSSDIDQSEYVWNTI